MTGGGKLTAVLAELRKAHGKTPEFLMRRVRGYEARVCDSGGHVYGRAPGHGAIEMISNDYLSLARHPAILRAQADAMLEYGNGNLMSPVFIGEDSPQRRLERRIAGFMAAEDGLLSQSGWCANVGLLQSIADPATPVYLDMAVHMSFLEGCRSAGVRPRPFRHNDPASLNHQIAKFGPGVVVVDAVYSTSGSVCPLRDMADVGGRHGCILVVDESHALATHGPEGQGLVYDAGLVDRVHFRTASLAKGFAGRGGIVVGPARLVEFLRYEARPAIFSSTVLPHEIVGFGTALDVITAEGWRREALVRNADHLRQGLLDLGYPVGASQSQIISLEPGPEWRTVVLREALETRNVFGSTFASPATPKNRSLIRFSVNCTLTQEALDTVLGVCGEIRDQVGYRDWPASRRGGQSTNRAAA